MDYPKPPTLAASGPPSRWRRRLRRAASWCFLALAILGVLALASPALYRWWIGDDLEQAVAEAERFDPGKVRWTDLEQARGAVPDAENGALLVLAAAKALPAGWPRALAIPEDVPDYFNLGAAATFEEIAEKVGPNVVWPPSLGTLLREEAARTQAAVRQANLEGVRAGRYPGEAAPPHLGGAARLEALRPIRAVAAGLLLPQALAAAQADRPAEAMLAMRRLLGVARSLGDEPGMAPNLIRASCGSLACAVLEQVLGTTQPSDADLQALHEEFARERREPLWLRAVRGERAELIDAIEAALDGKPSWLMGLDGAAARQRHAGAPPEQPPGLLTRYVLNGWWRDNGAAAARGLTLLAEAAKSEAVDGAAEAERLLEEQRLALARSAFCRFRFALWGLLLPDTANAAEALRRWRTELACAEAAAACERFRLKHGRWPRVSAELTPDFLKEPARDPYSGRPLLLRRTANGLIVYSVGKDRKDDGGQIRSDPGSPFKAWTNDVGLQLWDVAARRQPP